MDAEKKIAGVTAEMIKAAKEKYGDRNVKLAELIKDDNGVDTLTVLVRVPDRQTMNQFEKWIDQSPGKAKDILLKACLLSHKDEVIADDDLYYSALDAVTQLIPVRRGIIKNC